MSKHFLKKITFVIVLLMAVAVFAQRPTDFKDMDSVKVLYLAPMIGDDQNMARFRAALKWELVRNGFVVIEKAEGADATLILEFASDKKGSEYTVETHANLDAGATNRASWNNGGAKSGTDLERLLNDRAKFIAQSLKTYKFDVVIKKQEKNEKEAKH